MDILIAVANDLTKYLRFTGETSVSGSKVPVLDTQIWLGEKAPTGVWYKGLREHDRKAPGMKRSLKGRRIIGRSQRLVCYQLFKKPMASNLGILRRSAVT